MANVGHFSAVTLVGSGSSPALAAVAADIQSIKTAVGTVTSDTSAIRGMAASERAKLDAIQADVVVIKAQTAK